MFRCQILKKLPPAEDFNILGIINWREFEIAIDVKDYKCVKSSLKYWGVKPFSAFQVISNFLN